MKANPWDRLVSRAREAGLEPDETDVFVPLGFAARVVALARQQAEELSWRTWLDRRAWRALALAGGVALASVMLNLPAVMEAYEQEVLAADDPVIALWDLS